MSKFIKYCIKAFALFILVSIFTYPLIFKFTSYIPAFYSTDEPYAALWHFWWLAYSHQQHLISTTTSFIAAPFGFTFAPSGYYLWGNINKILSIVLNNIVAYNIQVVLSYMLSFWFMFLLVKKITKNYLSSIFSALIYTFCPYHAVRTWQHLGLAQIQWIPLYLLSLVNFAQEQSKKNILFAALCFALVFNFDFYYAYFTFIVTVVFFIYVLIQKKYLNKFKFVFSMLFVGAVCFIFILPNLVNVFLFMKQAQLNQTAQGDFGYIRNFGDLFAQSARPLSYLLPVTTHPIFGGFAESMVGSSLYGVSLTEHALYLGWVGIIFAIFASRVWLRKRNHDYLNCDERFYLGFFVVLAFVAWLFSQPPWWQIGRFKLYMPAFFMYKLLPMFRANCRFGIILMLAIAVLAGFGLKLFLQRFQSQKTRVVVTILLCSLVLFEFWNYPPFKVVNVKNVNQVYYWLRDEPGNFVVAEYPLDADSPNELYKFYQTVHKKKIINGIPFGSHAQKVARKIINLTNPNTARILSWMGVKYVLVHREAYLSTGLVEIKQELESLGQIKGLRFKMSFAVQECRGLSMCPGMLEQVDVYEIVASPLAPN